ncbi:MAG TPA: hypothetical protein VGX76_01525, partial [Pirellulales bacterium]|nr:hypothetical protein [Pirellulales bacterium]
MNVRFELDAPGNVPVTSLSSGENFTLQVFVQDVRTQATGVYQAYFNLDYDSTVVSVNGPVAYGTAFDSGHQGNTSTAGVLANVGGIDSGLPPSPPGSEELLVSVSFHAIAGGSFELTPVPTDIGHQVELFDSGAQYGLSQISFDGPGSQSQPVTVSTGPPDASLTAQSTTLAATEGAMFSGKVATFTDADPNGTISQYSTSIVWGDFTPSLTGTVTTSGDGTFTVLASHTYAEEAPNLAVT